MFINQVSRNDKLHAVDRYSCWRFYKLEAVGTKYFYHFTNQLI
jgi:hypothetical protein